MERRLLGRAASSPASQILESTKWKGQERFRCLVVTTPASPSLREGCAQASGHSWQGSVRSPKAHHTNTSAAVPTKSLAHQLLSSTLGPPLPASPLSYAPHPNL